MIIVRNCFNARPGCASKLAAQIKETASGAGLSGFRVLTDVTGDFNRVVFEVEATDFAAYDAMMKGYRSDAKVQERMKSSLELWLTGSREILQVM